MGIAHRHRRLEPGQIVEVQIAATLDVDGPLDGFRKPISYFHFPPSKIVTPASFDAFCNLSSSVASGALWRIDSSRYAAS